MTTPEILEEISRALALLALQTAAENLAGLYSKNRMTEDLLLPLFRILFSATDLRNANDGVNNYPHIDLIGTESRIAIQVTVERTATKVTSTITGFLESSQDESFDRLVLFILTPTPPHFQKPTTDAWKTLCGTRLSFQPSRDIINPLSLMPLIQALTRENLETVHQVIAKSVFGTEFIDVESQLENVSSRALLYEKSTKKYIPDVFMETNKTKQFARIFCHPVLFFPRQIERFPERGIIGWNEFLTRVGLDPLPMPDKSRLRVDGTIATTIENALVLPDVLSDTLKAVTFYGETGRREIPVEKIKPSARAFYEENSWSLTNDLGYGFKYNLETFVKRSETAGKRLFMLTGSAGQGKTNFLCDLVETFLLPHVVPTAYISVRKLALQYGGSLGQRVSNLIFDHKVNSFQEAAALLSTTAERTQKPFVLIFDGLNEHPNGPLFSQELEAFLHELLAFPLLRVIMTCRTEFFQQRFGNLLGEPFAAVTVRQELWGRHFDEEEKEDMVAAYFRFFGVRSALVGVRALGRLEEDVLLLRFFCEAYGTLGKDEDYQQPRVNGIYRDEIFDLYMKHKLEAIDKAAAIAGIASTAQGKRGGIQQVLALCLDHMLSIWQFDNVPISIVPEQLSTDLERLLEEELIVRRDAPTKEGFFSPNEETLNFTFDEFRDFLLAQYLVQSTFSQDPSKFEDYMSRAAPSNASTSEGLKRFLFFIARKNDTSITFKEYYVTQPWYADVYHEEVFNLPGYLLTGEDVAKVRSMITECDYRARRMGIQLAINWDKQFFPFLNLDLLLEIIALGNDDFYQKFVVATFATKRFESAGASAAAFATFVEEHIFPLEELCVASPIRTLLRFLVFLLPIDASFDLESPAYSAMHVAVSQQQEDVVAILCDSLQASFTNHVPFVWRLLTQAEKSMHSERALDLARSYANNELPAVTRREVNRFLQAASQEAA